MCLNSVQVGPAPTIFAKFLNFVMLDAGRSNDVAEILANICHRLQKILKNAHNLFAALKKSVVIKAIMTLILLKYCHAK